MKNLNLLFKYIEPKKHFSMFGKNKIAVNNYILSGGEIYFLFEHIKWMESQSIVIKTDICFKCFAFKSSDVINVLEILMLYLAENYENQFKVIFEKEDMVKGNILFINSLLPRFNNSRLGKQYCNAFYKDAYTPTHYRHFIDRTKYKESDLSVVNDNVKYTIQNGHTMYDLACDSAECVTEMIDNVLGHSDADCLVDVKVSRNINGNVYVSLNVISISDIFIGSKLLEMIENENHNYSGYKIVAKAIENHKSLFSNEYDDMSFAFVCSFQNTVSTRENTLNSGGTGFTTLIRNIHNKSFNEEYDSYILSGNNTLYFKNKYLVTDDSGIIGFNDENDFYKQKPNSNILKKEAITFPGTIFCVNLITEYVEYENN